MNGTIKKLSRMGLHMCVLVKYISMFFDKLRGHNHHMWMYELFMQPLSELYDIQISVNRVVRYRLTLFLI